MLNLRRAIGTVALALSGQAGVQLVGMLVGLAIVRGLTVEEYAYYTVAMLCVSMATVLADSGINNASLALAGRRWQEPEWVSAVVASARRWRLRLLAGTGVLSVLALAVLVSRLGANLLTTTVLCLAIVPLIAVSMLGQLREMPLRIMRRVGSIQGFQLQGTLLRATLTLAALMLLPRAATMLVASMLAGLFVLHRLRGLGEQLGLGDAPPAPSLDGELRHAFLNAFPTAVYFCVSGQITYLLVSLFAGVSEVAGLGAIGRFSVVFVILNTSLALVVTPWLARRPDDDGRIRQAYLLALASFGGLVLLVAGLLVVTREPLLWIVGSAYGGLQVEFVYLVVSSAIGSLSGAAYHLAAARNVYVNPILSVSTSIAVQAMAIVMLDLSRLVDVILVGMSVNAWGLAMHVTRFLISPHRATAR